MARVTGIGGVFHRARDPEGLARWYEEVLGVPVDEEGYNVFWWGEGTEDPIGTTTFHLMANDDEYFGDSPSTAMISFRVDDLDGMLDQLRYAGARIDDDVEEHDYGRFAWAHDPEGNRIELWEPAPGN